MSYRLFAATWAAALLLFTTHTTSAGGVSLKRLNVDMAVLVAKVASRKDQFAIPIRESFSTASAGAWTIEGAEAVWRHSVSVPSAVTMSFYADHVRLPAAARLLVTNAAGKAFTYRQEHWQSSELWSFLHAGESLSLELRVPATTKSSVKFSVAELQAGYRNVLGGADHPAYRKAAYTKAAGSGSACDVNYECKRNSVNTSQSQAVLGVTFGNTNFCTGSLVNNTAGNLRSFVLTAGHCNHDMAEPAKSAYSLYWDVSTPCGGDLEFVVANADVTSSGGVERARSQDSLLIEANTAPPAGARPYWAGIDASDPQTGVSGGVARYDAPMYGIHHAQSLSKQWVESSSARKSDGFPAPAGDDIFYDSLRISVGPVGTTGRVLAGASGSPLFSSDNKIIGTLVDSNLSTSCDVNETGSAGYQRIGPVWASLKPWLDPSNTGALQISGKSDPTRGATPVVTASISPNPTTSPAAATLTWSATNALTCSISGVISESNVPASGTRSLASSSRAAGDYTVTVACSSEEGTTGSKSVTWQVMVPVGLTMGLSPSSVNTSQTSTLNWNAPGATACTASGEWSGSKSTSGSMTVGPYSSAGTKTFGLQCTNTKGSQDATATLTVSSAPVPAPTVSLSAFPSSISTGSGSSLSWSSTNATSCTASGAWSGSKATSGSESTGALAAGSYTYNLSCTGAGGTASQSTTVTASTSPPPPPPTGAVDITLTPGNVVVGNSATLTWSATDVTSCSASGAWSGPRALSGSESTGVKSSEGTYTYTLSCLTSALTSVTKSVTLTVQPMGAPTLSMQISPSSLMTGNAATISWVSSNATSCNAGGGFWDGAKALSGSESTGIISIAGTRNYTLVCSNTSGGVIQQTVAVTATAPPTNPPDEVVVEGEGGGASMGWLLLTPFAAAVLSRRRMFIRVYLND